MLVPGPPYNGNGSAVRRAEREDEVGRGAEPALHVFLVKFPVGKNAFNHLVGRKVPGIASGQGVAGMPAQGHDAPRGVACVGDDGLTHQFEGHSVYVALLS